MLVYQDLLTGDELLSDSFPYREIENGILWEVDGNVGIMSEVKPAVKKWKEMKTDVLIESFKELNIIELFHVSQVCQLWRLACSDPLLWGTLDFGLLESNFIPTMAPPYVFVDKKSDEKLIKLLKIAMPISCGNVTNLVFHFNLYMEDDHLTYISERCPHLKRLVMPAWNRITKTGIWQAIKRWKELESLTIFSISHLPDIMGEISRNCENFSTLKVTGTFDGKLASEIAHNLPRLKIISLRWSILTREALLVLLDRMEHLEILNITHCFLVENLTPGKKVLWELGSDILNKAKRLKEFYYCRNISCETCQRMIKDKGLKRWYRYEESFWRKDEVKLLALGEDYGKLFNKACLETLDNDKWFKN